MKLTEYGRTNMSMKRNTLTMVGLAILAGMISATAQPGMSTHPAPLADTTDYSKIFKDDKEKYSYAIGMFFGNNIKGLVAQESNTVDIKVIEKALMDTANGKSTLITLQQDHDLVSAFQMQVRAEQMEKQNAKVRAISEPNLKAGSEFLAKNKTQPGVITLPNGLQYKILTAGTGDKPKATDTVTVNYKGTHLDGSEFDSSTRSGIHDFQVTHVIPGWTEALQLMPAGSKWQLFIPNDLAYGMRGAPPSIMPGESLIFEVELQAVKPTAAAPTAQMTSDIIKVPSAEGLKRGEKIETIKASDVGKMGGSTNN